MFNEATDKNRQELYFIGLHHENFKSTTIEGRGFQGQWTPKGDRLLYSVYHSLNNFNPTLWTVYAQGNDIGLDRRNLGLNTWADKCAFADHETVYCGVPKELPEGAGLFPGLADDIPDYLYKVNLRTGSKTLIADPYGNFHLTNLQVSPDGSTLYFVDGFTDTLQSIKLK
jgi:Tol biopolymer transport system component